MTEYETDRVLLRDGAGTYYILPGTLLERYRVPEEQKSAIEDALAEDTDAQGFAMGSPAPILWRIAPAVALKLTLPDPGPDDYRVDPQIGQGSRLG